MGWAAPLSPERTRTMQMIATASFVGVIDGVEHNVSSGVTRVAGDHPLALAYPHLFAEDKNAKDAPEVEQATAAPGEKRGAKK